MPHPDNEGDRRLDQTAFGYGLDLRRHPEKLKDIRSWIRRNICTSEGQGLYRSGPQLELTARLDGLP